MSNSCRLHSSKWVRCVFGCRLEQLQKLLEQHYTRIKAHLLDVWLVKFIIPKDWLAMAFIASTMVA